MSLDLHMNYVRLISLTSTAVEICPLTRVQGIHAYVKKI